jgi:hypothetical protein
MTEAEWQDCGEPDVMLMFLWGKASNRKSRLFACGDCRRKWEWWFSRNEEARRAVMVAEQYADGRTTDAELAAADHSQIRYHVAHCVTIADAGISAIEEARTMLEAAVSCVGEYADLQKIKSEEKRSQVALLRDIFGNPFRPVAFSPEWRTDTAVSLARQMYENREFSAMPILADALQDAGCDSEEVLNHCRDADTPYVRGCWVVDLV